jgi:asparagine N-glycosylation enzyme membrane subunit Stt3
MRFAMLNAEPPAATNEEAKLERIVAAGPVGAALLAGLATAIIVAIWVGFYLFVFVPRSLP